MTDPTPEAFTAVAGLVALITDAKACGRRLAELQAATDAANKAPMRRTKRSEARRRSRGACPHAIGLASGYTS
jgi:hypothetical protein